MLQRLPVTLAKVKAGNTSENLLNEIRQILYSFLYPIFIMIYLNRIENSITL